MTGETVRMVTTAHGPLASFKFFWASKNWRVRYLYDQLDLRLLKYYDLVLMVSSHKSAPTADSRVTV